MMCPNQEHRSLKPTTYIFRRGFQNAFSHTPTMVSSWHDQRYMTPRERFGHVREVPVCYNCGFRGHGAQFCGQRRRSQQRYYEAPSASSQQNSWHWGLGITMSLYAIVHMVSDSVVVSEQLLFLLDSLREPTWDACLNGLLLPHNRTCYVPRHAFEAPPKSSATRK
ncbi:hypothetical protein HPB51_023453 [Rhipicephalus microplus]|uniref:CCHC-type domain-containing protein n=1 Tax=Rhipicephalus microplus TaxID=6941 RepID=A0A9J6F8D1_RHIMP|nr:hypothetical protein HPB51_023453 [Rhipicephalus microplus]